MSTIDLDRAVETFAASTDLTVGLEEEFSILDRETLDLAPRSRSCAMPRRSSIRCCTSTSPVSSSRRRSRSSRESARIWATRCAASESAGAHCLRWPARAAQSSGATGTHPWADYREQPVIDTEHYRRVEEGLKYVAWRNNTFSLHVHVGVRDIDRAVRVCDRLRPLLPLLLAVSANSPFLDGRLAGLHSARTQTFTRSFPRCGVPYAFGGWPAFRRYLELLIATNSIIEFTQVWWSVRPHLSYGTVEVRICDVQASAPESEALAGLIVACVAQTLLELDGGDFSGQPGYLIQENMWRAIRYGLDGRMIDFATGEEYPSVEIVERLLASSAPARAAHRLELEPACGEPNGAQRQRAMIDAGVSMREAFESCVRETRATYSEEVRA